MKPASMLNGMKPSMLNRKIIVTGGSRGIGSAIVRLLAEEGASVAFSYASQAEAAEKLLKSLPGVGHQIFQMDVGDPQSIESSFEKVFEAWDSQLDGLVNNAGITRDGLLLRMKNEDFQAVMDTNLRGAFITTRWVCKPFMKARRGTIVNITSVVGQTGNAGQANYSASKGGLIAFSKSVALELASRNIRINCVAPGFIETDMTSKLGPEIREKSLAQIPLRLFGDPMDIAYGVRFLLSDESKYITGHTLSINGGMCMI